MDETLKDLAAHVSGALPEAVIGHTIAFGELTLETTPAHVVKLATFLRDDPACLFACIVDVCGADYPARELRLDVVYHLLSLKQNMRVRVKVATDGATPVPSVTGVYPGANWFEREAYDMYGILFTGHPELRRLLTDYGFDGHPLRKDFPLTGFVEVRYDDEAKRVIYEPVRLAQEFRNFDFLSPWEGVEYVLPGDEKASSQPGAPKDAPKAS
ncbi:NADH-quinone oxidoreductase subunit C [Azorhizobium doebereinerae]|uniref:NADH-quinone oxidoreductase subunit C n=1 Tax=Azorhizobium doebereinerae TaxID=281091 RepID=UPI000421E55A|nr:NADH-quinone oxidoreductase subunit C [Azorhizobium doebereinerae]